MLSLHLSLLERTIGGGASSGGRQRLAGIPLRTLKFDKLMFALILCCNYFNNLHSAPTAVAAAHDRRETKDKICFCRLPPNSWQTVAMSPPLPVRTRSRRRWARKKKHTYEAPKLRKLFVRVERSLNNNQVLIILRSSKVKVSSCSHRKSSFEIRIDLAAWQLWLRRQHRKHCLSMVRQLLISFCQL